jgi:ferredoxin
MASMAYYNVSLDIPDVGLKVVKVRDDVYILDAAEDAGIELPCSCRAGSCSTCAAKLVSGSVDQREQTFLDDDQVKESLILLCVSYPMSNCVIKTHREEDLYRE